MLKSFSTTFAPIFCTNFQSYGMKQPAAAWQRFAGFWVAAVLNV